MLYVNMQLDYVRFHFVFNLPQLIINNDFVCGIKTKPFCCTHGPNHPKSELCAAYYTITGTAWSHELK